MAHNIDMTNGRANIAYLGSRKAVWHHLGHEMQPGMTIDQWAKQAGLEWSAIKVPAIADLSGPAFRHIEPTSRQQVVDGQVFIVRNDNGQPLGYASDGYQPVQPRDVLNWFDRYIAVDSRFQLDVAGSLKGGKIIWATATYRDGVSVAGDQHVARLLMTTTFDLSGSTINQGTMTRTVCNNTLNVALADKRAVIRTRHNTKFDARAVGKELATIAQGFDGYKKMGDAMAQTEMSGEETSRLFKSLLDIPFDMPSKDVSTRKLNQFESLVSAYRSTVSEGTEANTAWTALNAVTRYVDHDRSTRGGESETEARFHSAQFGSGAALKAKAAALLMAKMEATLGAARPDLPVPVSTDLLRNMEAALAS